MHFIFRRNDESSKIRSYLSRRWNFVFLLFTFYFKIWNSFLMLSSSCIITSSSHSHIIFFCVEFIHCHIKDANNASNFDSNFYNEGTVAAFKYLPQFFSQEHRNKHRFLISEFMFLSRRPHMSLRDKWTHCKKTVLSNPT